MRYQRTINERFLEMLASGGPLHSLVADPGTINGIPLDVQLRPGNKVTIYAGLTALASLHWFTGGRVRVTATNAYESQMPEYFTEYSSTRLPELVEGWQRFLREVAVAARYTANEGAVQARLIQRYGAAFRAGDPWCFFDREAVLQHPGEAQKSIFEDQIKNALRSVVDAVKHDSMIRVGRNAEKAFGDELDLLGVASSGDLIVAEVKDGAAVAGLYMAPVQLAGYYCRWTRLPDASCVASDLNALIAQKVILGLLPSCTPQVRSDFRVKPLIFSSAPRDGSSAWSTFDAVLSHLARHHSTVAEELVTHVVSDGGSEVSCQPRVRRRLSD